MTVLAGFHRIPNADSELWVADGFDVTAQQLGLTNPQAWIARLRSGTSAGRGTIAFVEHSKTRLVLKQLRRGGLAAALWCDRFTSRARLIDNLTVPALARRRGVTTPAAQALLLVSGPPGLWRGWLALDAVPAAKDLAERLAHGAPTVPQWRAALAAVRILHDACIEHPDLNLGNLLLDEDDRGWIIDLDRCRVAGAPLNVDARVDGLRRIERSYLKTCWLRDLDVDSAIDWPNLYAGDAGIAARWEQRRTQDEAKLARHRRAWRR